MNKIKGFVIHLERATGRRKHAETLCHALPFAAEIISAIDGQKLSDEEIAAVYQRHKYKPSYPFELSHSEIACFLSHRKAWQAIVDQNLDGGFILEDDVALDYNFLEGWALAAINFTPQHFIRFPFRIKEKGQKIAETATHKLIIPCPVGLGQVAQLVGRNAAEKLLIATEKFDRPVDTLMQLFWETGVHPLSLLPGGVSEISSKLGGSTVQRKRQAGDKLKREFLRPLYRFKIARLSARKAARKS